MSNDWIDNFSDIKVNVKLNSTSKLLEQIGFVSSFVSTKKYSVQDKCILFQVSKPIFDLSWNLCFVLRSQKNAWNTVNKNVG